MRLFVDIHNKIKKLKHSCPEPRAFGQYTAGCPRCDQVKDRELDKSIKLGQHRAKNLERHLTSVKLREEKIYHSCNEFEFEIGILTDGCIRCEDIKIRQEGKQRELERKLKMQKEKNQANLKAIQKHIVNSLPRIYQCNTCKDSKKIKVMTQFGIVTKDCECIKMVTN